MGDCGGVSCPACTDAVDGGWGTWSSWTKCNAKCPNTNGKEVRTRKCDKPAPGDGGKDCVGKNKGERSCKIKCSSTPCKETCKNKNKKCSSCKKNIKKCKRSKKIQKQCPVTCNKCNSGGSGGNKPCKDKAGAKKCKKDKKKCKSNKKVQKNCAKTCKKCK